VIIYLKKGVTCGRDFMDMEQEVIAIFTGAAILFAIIGMYFVIRAWILWARTPDDVLRAKAFITRQFLHRSFILIFILIVLVAFHTFLEFFVVYGYPSYLGQFEHLISVFYLSLLSVSMLLLAILAYYCHRLLSPKNRPL
jgi:ABC-type dipeptide/oligopeptide/nickel transport system permease component